MSLFVHASRRFLVEAAFRALRESAATGRLTKHLERTHTVAQDRVRGCSPSPQENPFY